MYRNSWPGANRQPFHSFGIVALMRSPDELSDFAKRIDDFSSAGDQRNDTRLHLSSLLVGQASCLQPPLRRLFRAKARTLRHRAALKAAAGRIACPTKPTSAAPPRIESASILRSGAPAPSFLLETGSRSAETP